MYGLYGNQINHKLYLTGFICLIILIVVILKSCKYCHWSVNKAETSGKLTLVKINDFVPVYLIGLNKRFQFARYKPGYCFYTSLFYAKTLFILLTTTLTADNYYYDNLINDL